MTRSFRALMTGGALAAAVALAAPAAFAQSQPNGGAPLTIQAVTERPSLNLSAYGEVKAAPDMATISFGVVTEAPTAAEAMSQNAARMTQVMTALRRAGIAEVLVLRVIEETMVKRRITGELSMTLEDNVMINRFLDAIGADRYKTYRIYSKSLVR
jgi:hypothetical protein